MRTIIPMPKKDCAEDYPRKIIIMLANEGDDLYLDDLK